MVGKVFIATFQYIIANIEQITYFELSVHNQDDEFIPIFGYYILLLQFTRHTMEKKFIIRHFI
jgi:hypothetical protein